MLDKLSFRAAIQPLQKLVLGEPKAALTEFAHIRVYENENFLDTHSVLCARDHFLI